MTAMTGIGRCTRCHGDVFLVRNVETGKIVRLETTPAQDGRWKVKSDPFSGMYVAKYDPKGELGYRGHDLPCLQQEAGPRKLVLGTMVEGKVQFT